MALPPKGSFSNLSESKFQSKAPLNGFALTRRPVDPTPADDGIPHQEGWNLIGMIDHKGGIGNAARSNVAAMSSIVPISRTISYPSGRIKKAMDVPAIHGHNYLHWNPACVNMDRLRERPWFRKGKNIGYWAWETDEAPAGWLPYDAGMRQIWVPSEFVKHALQKAHFLSPIFVIPHAIDHKPQHEFAKEEDPITILIQFDGHSRINRKRPDLSLKAATEAALRTKQRVRIIVKCHHYDPNQLQLAEYPNLEIELVHGWKTPEEMEEIWESVDILVSLNRGEGFGLPLVEAMARGIAVVATHWGAAEEYMTVTNSYPVAPERIEHCTLSQDTYFKTGHWAMPSVDNGIHQIMLAIEEIRSGRINLISGAARARADDFSRDHMISKMKAAISQL